MSVRVGILGATGAVGQRFIQLLDDHPTFDLAAVTASADSAGKTYREAAKWRVDTPIPDDVAEMEVTETTPAGIADADVDLLLRRSPGVASEVEPAFLEEGYVVSSNSSNDRMAADVPLTIPEINPGHLDLIEVQRDERGWDGALVKNPNCSTITMVPTLAAIDEFGLRASGSRPCRRSPAPATPALPRWRSSTTPSRTSAAGGEDGDGVAQASRRIRRRGGSTSTAPTWPPPVTGSRRSTVILRTSSPSSPRTRRPLTSARQCARSRAPPRSPARPTSSSRCSARTSRSAPQPRLDRTYAGGMGIVAGGVQATNAGMKYNCLAHNTIRGAAGASLLNGELLVEEGYV